MASTAEAGNTPRLALSWVLTGIVAGIIAFNSFVFWLTAQQDTADALDAIWVGAWVFEPILFGIWAALGPGKLILRIVLIVPCLVLAVAVPGLYRPSFLSVQWYEFAATLGAGFMVFTLATVVMLIFRRIFGWRIDRNEGLPRRFPWRFQFDVKYLMWLITLYALALGIVSSLTFGPPQSNQFFGPDFVVFILVVGGAIIALLLSPLIAVPLMVLTERPAEKFFWRAVAIWLVVTTGVVLFCVYNEMLDSAVTLYPFLAQLGATLAGTLAALPLRLADYRLTKRDQIVFVPEHKP